MSRAFVHGHTLLHSWCEPLKSVIGLPHGATFVSVQSCYCNLLVFFFIIITCVVGKDTYYSLNILIILHSTAETTEYDIRISGVNDPFFENSSVYYQLCVGMTKGCVSLRNYCHNCSNHNAFNKQKNSKKTGYLLRWRSARIARLYLSIRISYQCAPDFII